ncbi:MAG: GNAT family N-acetyltransferase [Anaerolineae bacterium]|nr:GNAT family N-acetyltransferase [Anaerolineae bacterium]
MPLNLSTSRIRLRPLETRDLEALVLAYQDLDMQLTTDGDAPPMSDVETRALWTEILTNPGADLRYFAIEPLAGNPGEGHIVGACSLQHIDFRNRHAELGIFMTAQEWRGQGYGTEAVRLLLDYGFEVVRLDKVYLGVYDFNEAGLRSYERVGFRYEGRLRQMLHYEGCYWDEWPMRILRGEWEQFRLPPAHGLRPYHPDDYMAALNLIQQEMNLPDSESARAVLRRWWRQIDRTVYGYQAEGALVGLLTISVDIAPPTVYEWVVSDAFKRALDEAIVEIK